MITKHDILRPLSTETVLLILSILGLMVGLLHHSSMTLRKRWNAWKFLLKGPALIQHGYDKVQCRERDF